MVPGMLRSLLLAAFLCPLALAQSKPPATLAELKANPAGLTAYSGDIRGEYGQFPVSSVYVRETAEAQISYLVYGDNVFGYSFRFQNPGSDTPLWRQSVDASLDATFPPETFRREEVSSMALKNIYYRTVAVLNTKAYEEALRNYRQAQDARILALVTGGTGGGAAAVTVENAAVPGTSRSLADYLKSFPETVPASLENTLANYCNAILAEFPYDSLRHRMAGEVELLIVSRKGTVIGYLAKFPVTAASELGMDIRNAGLAAAFPDPAFERQDAAAGQGFLIYSIKDRTAFTAAREAHLAEEAAKLKALLNP
jgi:hypothetical protein